jgi:hypothetical protein
MKTFVQELKRRRVYRVAIADIVVDAYGRKLPLKHVR